MKRLDHGGYTLTRLRGCSNANRLGRVAADWHAGRDTANLHAGAVPAGVAAISTARKQERCERSLRGASS